MMDNLDEEKAIVAAATNGATAVTFYSNRSTSSSTSSLLSYSSSFNSALQTPLAPPPTPLSVNSMSQQASSANLHPMNVANSGVGHLQPVAIVTNDLLLFNNNNNNNNNNNSSFIDFNRQQLASAAATQQPLTTMPKLNLLIADSNHLSTSSSTDFSMASSNRFKTNRRECKSTSDESYTLELEEQSLIASAANKIEKMSHANGTGAGDQFYSNLYKLNQGQFGFKPVRSTLAGLLSPTSISGRRRSDQFSYKLKQELKHGASGRGLATGHHHHHHQQNHATHKKVVKRLHPSSACNKMHFSDNNSKADFTHNKKLFAAVLGSDLKTVCELLDSNVYDVNAVDDKQRTCLHIASSRGCIEIVRVLIEYGANPNLRDCVNNLPIHLAIISSHVQVVTLLLEAGTDIHTLDLNGKTVLHLAGTRLRWLLNDENNQASPKLKFEAIMIMNMIKEYLRRKKTCTDDLDKLTTQLENTFNLDDINNLTKELLNQFETLNICPIVQQTTTANSNGT